MNDTLKNWETHKRLSKRAILMYQLGAKEISPCNYQDARGFKYLAHAYSAETGACEACGHVIGDESTL